ncbi:MAG: spermidine/putrescine ABC transporter substrate-binding protein [Actinomycetota bacterium]
MRFASWPLYIDQEKVDGEVRHPSLEAFTAATGITVAYEPVMESLAGFYGKIQPQLAAGDPTGWDIILVTPGREFSLLTRNGWVLPLDHARTPNFTANAAPFVVDPPFDPGNRSSMAWQSGLTGIGVHRELVSGEVTTLDDLADPAKVGMDRVGMLRSDMADFVMINLGIDPEASGPAEWREAADWLLWQRDQGTVRAYYDQGYVDDFTNGNLSATMAWSGDVLYQRVWAGMADVEFVVPDGGALLWTDNMLIPTGSENPAGALALMDWFYRPEIATMVTEYVLYMSPVRGVDERIRTDADAAEDRGETRYAERLRATAADPFLFPDAALLARTRYQRVVTSDEEAEEWDAIFTPIWQA